MDESRWSLQRLNEYAETAEQFEFRYPCANDYLPFPRPWFDGPTALAMLHTHTEHTLLTAIRYRSFAAGGAGQDLGCDRPSPRWPLVVVLGFGSSDRDYEVVGVPASVIVLSGMPRRGNSCPVGGLTYGSRSVNLRRSPQVKSFSGIEVRS